MDYKKIIALASLGILILAAMIIIIGPRQILNALSTADSKFIALAVVIQFIIMGLWNYRWSLICNSLKIPHKFWSLFAVTIVGLAVNDITPSGRSGGEPVRAYILSRSSSVDFNRTFASVMADKIFDTFPFFVLAIFAIAYLIFTVHLGTSLFITLIVLLVLFIALLAFIIFLCINEEIGEKTIKWVFRQLRRFITRDLDSWEQKAQEALLGFQDSLKYLMGDKKLLIIATIVSFLVWFLELMRVYVIFEAFGVHIAMGMIASVFLVSTLVGAIPALPGGLGSIDGIMILLYSMAGVTSSVSTAVTLVERIISLWMVIIIGLILLPFYGRGVLDKAESSKNS